MDSKDIISLPIKKFNSKDLSDADKEIMFGMYKTSYTLGGQPLWFTNKEQLFSSYPCFVSFGDNYTLVYAMFQFRKTINKISLVCHDGSENGKNLSIQLRVVLLKIKGWALEAKDKVSWILRSRYKTPIMDNNKVAEILEISKENININESFDYNNKESYQYTKTYKYINNDGNEITNEEKETLFGTEICDYGDSKECNRECKTGGEKRRSRRSKSKRSKSKRSKSKRSKSKRSKSKRSNKK